MPSVTKGSQHSHITCRELFEYTLLLPFEYKLLLHFLYGYVCVCVCVGGSCACVFMNMHMQVCVSMCPYVHEYVSTCVRVYS